MLAAVIALSLGGVANAGVDWSKYAIPTPAQVVPLNASGNVAPLSLTRMAANLREGEEWAEVWRICSHHPDRILTWQAKDNQFEMDREFTALFREELTNAGFKVSGGSENLFQAEGPSSDLEVGALITKLRVSECYYPMPMGNERSGPFVQMGVGTMAVEWQIYSVSQAKVLARIATEGGFKDKQTGALLAPYITKAFAENVRQLAVNPEFRRIVITKPSPVEPASAAPLLAIVFRSAPALPLSEAAKGAVSIIVAEGWGSGVLISPGGYILTNHHVAGGSGRVRIRWANGSESVGEVVRADRRRDVALIRTEAPQGLPLAIRAGPVTLGETVYAIGTPREREFAGTLTRGVVSAVDRRIEGQRYIQSDVAITHGNSGGPLLDEKGAVIGLSDMAYEPDGVSQNINFFIPIDDALKALAIEPAASPAAAPPKPRRATGPAQGKRAAAP
jgi:S1-C subfamily serine protease